MANHNVLGAWPVCTHGALLAGFIKRITKHCYKQNIKALGIMVSEKKFFVCFPIESIWELMTHRVGSFFIKDPRLAGFVEHQITLHHT